MNGVSIFNSDYAKFTNLALVGTACFVCSRIPDELLRCQQCKRIRSMEFLSKTYHTRIDYGCSSISYCSEACQTADVESHLKICLALQLAPESTPPFLRQFMFERGSTPYDLEPGIFLLYESEKESFERTIAPEKMTIVQNDLLLYEPRCAVCLRSADDMRSTVDPEYTTLLYCSHCRAAFACTEAHADEYHDEHCKELEDGERYTECEMNKRAYEDSLEIVTHGWTETETLWFPTRRKSDYRLLPTETDTLTAWDQWFADPTNLCPPDSSPILNRIRTKQLSIPMTVLYGMTLFDTAAGNSPALELPLLSSRTELDIAVIGAKEYELKFGGLACWEEILHNIPSLRKLSLRFIGPHIVFGLIGPKGAVNRAALKWELCDLCKEKGIEIRQSFHPAMFHEYVADPEKYSPHLDLDAPVDNRDAPNVKDEPDVDGKLNVDDGLAAATPAFQWPDLAVMFNTGMGISRERFNPKWSPTLEALAKNGVPALCTSFMDREAEEDEELLNFTQCDIVIGRHKNPWRSEVVTKTPFSRKRFFSYNQFIQGFRGIAEMDGLEGDTDLDDSEDSKPPFDEEKMIELLSQLLPNIAL